MKGYFFYLKPYYYFPIGVLLDVPSGNNLSRFQNSSGLSMFLLTLQREYQLLKTLDYLKPIGLSTLSLYRFILIMQFIEFLLVICNYGVIMKA